MTNNFKLECKNPTYANRLGKIEYGNNQSISNSDYLSKIIFKDECITNGVIVGSTVSKEITIEALSDYQLRQQVVNALIGVKYADTSEEYINMGEYTIQDENTLETAKNGSYKGVDNLSILDKPYICTINDFNNATIKDFLDDLCEQLNLTLKTQSFTNDDLHISGNPFTNNESCRTVLNVICKCSLTFASINPEDGELELRWLDDDISETFSKNEYNNLERNNTYGPINMLILRDPVVGGENVIRQDSESILQNGEHQFIIEDTYFLYTEELRELAIDNIWDKVKGLTYVDCKLTTNLGRPYLRAGNKISIQGDDGNYFNTYVLKHQFTYDGTFNSVIEAPSLTQEQEEKKNSTDFKTRFRNTERSVDKINGQIVDIIEEQTDTSTRLNQTISTLESTVSTVSSINTRVTDVENETETLTNSVQTLQSNTEYSINIINQQLIDGVVKFDTGTGYTFDIEGLKINRVDSILKLILDNNGLVVYRNQDEVLRADSDGVNAENMTVRKFYVQKPIRMEKTKAISNSSKVGLGFFYVGE